MLAVGTALIGGLVGAEVPLLMTLLQRGKNSGATDTGRVLANLNAADYLGALVGGLAWPFVVLPHLGMVRGAAVTGMINLAAAAVVALFLMRRVVSGRELATALAALAAAFALLTALIWVRNLPDSTPEVLTATGTRLWVVELIHRSPLPLPPQQ